MNLEKEEAVTRIARQRVIPVVTVQRSEQAVHVVESLVRGGLPVVELTLRTVASMEAVEQVCKHFGKRVMIGAGTVCNQQQAEAAIELGAGFIVSPGLDEEVVEYCRFRRIACFPGISTATELQRAFNLGMDTVKFFPAIPCGGLAMMKALAGPFPSIRFMPTGGISLQNMKEFLDYDRTTAVGGSWMIRPEWIAAEDYLSIEKSAAETVAVAEPG